MIIYFCYLCKSFAYVSCVSVFFEGCVVYMVWHTFGVCTYTCTCKSACKCNHIIGTPPAEPPSPRQRAFVASRHLQSLPTPQSVFPKQRQRKRRQAAETPHSFRCLPHHPRNASSSDRPAASARSASRHRCRVEWVAVGLPP